MSKILRAVAANAEATDVMIYFEDGTVAAAKPDDPRLEGITIARSPPPSAPPSRNLSKLALYRRLTDPELAELDAYLRDKAALRQRMNFHAATEFDRTDIQWRSIMMILYGPERANQILA